MNHTFNFWNLRSVIDDCRRDFLKVYSEGKGREEAMGRVKDLQTILDVSEPLMRECSQLSLQDRRSYCI